MKYRLFSALLAASLLVASCSKKKNEASAATSIDVQLKASNPVATLGRVQGGTLTWTAGTASATQVKFEAERGGSEVEYSRNLQGSVDLFAAAPVLGNITLQDGTYDEIELKAFLAPSGNTPALELRGSYLSNGVSTPVVFRAQEAVLLKAERHNVTLSGSTPYQAVAPVNLALGTQGINAAALDAAVRTNGSILITSSVNASLYATILNGLRSSHEEAGFHR